MTLIKYISLTILLNACLSNNLNMTTGNMKYNKTEVFELDKRISELLLTKGFELNKICDFKYLHVFYYRFGGVDLNSSLHNTNFSDEINPVYLKVKKGLLAKKYLRTTSYIIDNGGQLIGIGSAVDIMLANDQIRSNEAINELIEIMTRNSYQSIVMVLGMHEYMQRIDLYLIINNDTFSFYQHSSEGLVELSLEQFIDLNQISR